MKSIKYPLLTSLAVGFLASSLPSAHSAGAAEALEALKQGEENATPRISPHPRVSPEVEVAPPPRAVMGGEEAAHDNASLFIKEWRQQFADSKDSAHQRMVLGTILENAHRHLNYLLKGLPAADASPSPLSPQDSIHQAVLKLRPPSPEDQEDSVGRRLAVLLSALQTTKDEDLSTFASQIFKSLFEEFYHASLRRLKIEGWIRSQLLRPFPLSGEKAEGEEEGEE